MHIWGRICRGGKVGFIFFLRTDNDLARLAAQEGAFDANKHATRTVVTLLYRPVPADPPKTVTSDLRAYERLPKKAPP